MKDKKLQRCAVMEVLGRHSCAHGAHIGPLKKTETNLDKQKPQL